MEQPEPTQADAPTRRWVIKEQHYKTVSEWLERLGLVVVASLVIQKIVSGASFGDPVVIIGSMYAIVIYAAAILLLLRT